jgi:hypothetical protein
MSRYHRNPHVLPGLTLVEDLEGEEPTLELMQASDLLSEPPKRSGQWVASCVRRLLAASSGPVAVGLQPGEQLERLERAGWFNVAEGSNIEDARIASWRSMAEVRRLGIGFGSPRPSLVVVGDRTGRAEQLPWASRSGTWLFLALRLLGYDELTVYLTNARDTAGRRRSKRLRALHGAFSAYSPFWIAAGREAHEVLNAAKIHCSYVEHPWAARRWCFSEGPEGYAEKLTKAGLQPGPWAGQLPLKGAPPVEKLPSLPSPYDLESVAYSRGVTPKRTGGKVTKIDSKTREEARRAFVIEGLKAVEVAKRYGLSVTLVESLSQEGAWRREREEHQRHVTEEAKSKHVKDEVRLLVQARRLSWIGSVQELQGVVKAQKEPDYRFTPNAARLLSQVALALSDAGSGEVEDGREQLAKRSLVDLAEQAIKQLNEGIGGGL